MSGGGAGKVYFVLYLAVILELLIIIVERDEAEEHLVKRQKESMKIVESILSQLQAGAGTEGINTRPQDEIILSEKLPAEQQKNFKKFRTYFIEVGVVDVAGADKLEGMEPKDMQEKVQTLKKLANVQELQYEIYYNPSKEVDVPSTPPDSAFRAIENKPMQGQEVRDPNRPDAQSWTLQASRRIELQSKTMDNYRNPIYSESATASGEIGRYAPNEAIASNLVFAYSPERTEIIRLRNSGKLNKRAFVVNFQPPSQPGWYKLRFSSRTNRILGLSADQNLAELSGETKVNIGTVQLKVRDLELVRRELNRQLEAAKLPDADALAQGRIEPENFIQQIETAKLNAADAETRTKIELYGYIGRLLAPGRSTSFDQNRGSIEIDIRVNQPDVPEQIPVVADLPDKIRVFDKLTKVEIPFSVSPSDGSTVVAKNPGRATVQDAGGTRSVGAGKIEKKVVLPISGNLTARAEPYILEVEHSNRSGKKNQEPSICSVYVFESKIQNAEFVQSALEAGWGDALEFTADPSSVGIPASQFRINIRMGTSDQRPPINKLSIAAADNVIVPQGVEKVYCTIGWEDPSTKEVVTLFDDSGDASLKRPMVILTNIKATPILDQQTGEFEVTGIQIRAPQISMDERAELGTPTAEITGQLRDLVSNESYRVIVVGKPTRVSGNEYKVIGRVVGGKFPLRKGQVKGSITLTVSATATSGGTTSKPRMGRNNLNISN